ncbi:MAG: hypothetical protein J5874_06265 [Oscillospiraceae bacterium]|nr:hypothetical protein [Oscillospiraceae bacterium]
MKKALLIILCTVFALSLGGCGAKYKEKDFIGKTSAEIIGTFGPFDCVTAQADADGLYKSCSCGYTVKEPRQGLFGTSEEVLFFIGFDENGVAVSCKEGYRPGG